MLVSPGVGLVLLCPLPLPLPNSDESAEGAENSRGYNLAGLSGPLRSLVS